MSDPIPSVADSPSALTPETQPPSDIADGVERRLDPGYVTLERWRAWFSVAIRAALIFGVAWGLFDLGLHVSRLTLVYGISAALVAAEVVRSQWWPAVAYQRAWYRVDHNGLEIREGVLWRSVTTVPRSRVQHTDVTQGPFERALGLGTLVVHTAGNAHARVALEGLTFPRALRIRQYLLPRDEHDVV